MLTLICGGPGVGKTSLACKFANDDMTGDKRFSNLQQLKSITKRLRPFGFDLTVPKDHTVFSDFKFYSFREYCRPLESYDIDGWRLGLPNPFFETSFLPSYSSVYLIEAQKYYDSRRTNNNPLPPWVMRFYERHRHNYLDIYMDCQRPVSIDKGIRGLAERFIFPINKIDKYNKFNELIRTVWQCVELSNTDAAEKYSDSLIKPSGACESEYIHEGNIHALYNSYGYWDTFYRGRNDNNFDLVKTGVSGRSLAKSDCSELDFDYDIPPIFLTWRKLVKET